MPPTQTMSLIKVRPEDDPNYTPPPRISKKKYIAALRKPNAIHGHAYRSRDFKGKGTQIKKVLTGYRIAISPILGTDVLPIEYLGTTKHLCETTSKKYSNVRDTSYERFADPKPRFDSATDFPAYRYQLDTPLATRTMSFKLHAELSPKKYHVPFNSKVPRFTSSESSYDRDVGNPHIRPDYLPEQRRRNRDAPPKIGYLQSAKHRTWNWERLCERASTYPGR